MEPLSPQFTWKGWTFTQVKREGNLAIYHRVKGRVEDWEVIRVKEKKAGSMTITDEMGVKETIFFTAKESYPSDEEWGDRGWTYTSEESAFEKFEQLKNQKKRTV